MKSLGVPLLALGALVVWTGPRDAPVSPWQELAAASAADAASFAPHTASKPPTIRARTTGGESAPAVTSTETEVVQRICVRCHNERRLTGNLSLEGFVVEEADQNADIAERTLHLFDGRIVAEDAA